MSLQSNKFNERWLFKGKRAVESTWTLNMRACEPELSDMGSTTIKDDLCERNSNEASGPILLEFKSITSTCVPILEFLSTNYNGSTTTKTTKEGLTVNKWGMPLLDYYCFLILFMVKTILFIYW